MVPGSSALKFRSTSFVDWTRNGGQRGRHSSNLSAPLRPIHGRRYDCFRAKWKSAMCLKPNLTLTKRTHTKLGECEQSKQD